MFQNEISVLSFEALNMLFLSKRNENIFQHGKASTLAATMNIVDF